MIVKRKTEIVRALDIWIADYVERMSIRIASTGKFSGADYDVWTLAASTGRLHKFPTLQLARGWDAVSLAIWADDNMTDERAREDAPLHERIALAISISQEGY